MSYDFTNTIPRACACVKPVLEQRLIILKSSQGISLLAPSRTLPRGLSLLASESSDLSPACPVAYVLDMPGFYTMIAQAMIGDRGMMRRDASRDADGGLEQIDGGGDVP